MCQLLGMNCNAPTDVTFSFRGFAQRGGHTDQHTDGWGIAFFEGNGSADDSACDKGLRHFVDHQPASSSPVAELISRYPIKSRNVISHIQVDCRSARRPTTAMVAASTKPAGSKMVPTCDADRFRPSCM